MKKVNYTIFQIGIVHSEILDRSNAPMQGYHGAPNVWIELEEEFLDGIHLLKENDEIILITWLHLAKRDVLKVRPRSKKNRPLTGVFATRSPDRPNPIGLHRVTIHEIVKNRLYVGPLEVLNGTPIIDIKSVLSKSKDY